MLAGCGAGVQERVAATTVTTGSGADSVLVPPTTGPAEVPPGQDPRDVLGEDPELNELASACFGGDLFACDTLFLRTDVDSPLEAYSQTCGGRVPEQAGAPGCAERFGAPVPAAQAPGDLGDDAVLDDLAEACAGGDARSCDDLYLRAPVGSAYEDYGSTCGGRLALPGEGTCENQFGAADA